MTTRANPTETEKRLDRIERAIAQLASAMRVMGGWRPQQNNQHELQAILDEQREAIALETRPDRDSAPEQRVKVA